MIESAESLLAKKLAPYTNNEKKTGGSFEGYTLEGITAALSILGNPQNSFLSVHVAGTNGKGSVCHMLSDILVTSGLKTGLYTSPHLVSVAERIRIDGEPVCFGLLFGMIEQIEHALSDTAVHLTYFDFLTVCSFMIFADAGVDIAVIETGLGGKLDSTNVLNPALSIITDISLDHTHILGSTLSEIAMEKAGIIKKEKPCITTNTDASTVSVLESAAAELDAPLFLFGRDFNAGSVRNTQAGISFDYIDTMRELKDIDLSLYGDFQSKNCSAVIKAASLLSEGFSLISEPAIRSSLGRISVPGRMQMISRNPDIIFDPAHNRQAVESLYQTVSERFYLRNILWIVSFMADKEPAFLIEKFRSMGAKNIIYCLLDDPGAYQPDHSEFQTTVSSDDVKTLSDIIRNHSGLTVFTGSFRLYSTAVRSARLLLDSHSKS